jgi:pimeloyl-ACP methyl ester carboxylesterase
MATAAPAAVSERIVELRDGKMVTRVLTAGEGPPLLFIHGAGGLVWDPLLEGLASRFSVYAPEHPGSGQSVGLEELRDIWDLVLYYNDLLDALGLEAVTVVGHSFGGMVATELAANNPNRVTKLVLIAPLGLWRDDTPIADIAGISPEKLGELVLADPKGPLAAALAIPVDDPEALFQAAMRMASILHFIWPIPDKGLSRRIHRVQAPTLLVRGRQDGLVPPVYADEFASRLRSAEVALVDQAGHLPQFEQPDEVRELVLKFLS